MLTKNQVSQLEYTLRLNDSRGHLHYDTHHNLEHHREVNPKVVSLQFLIKQAETNIVYLKLNKTTGTNTRGI